MSDKKTPEERVAVVIIHGIGEQKPMETLKGFVKGITNWIKNFNSSQERPRYWSRPDGTSELYETRMITMERDEVNPKTDFYEFYYAHHMRNTSFQHLMPWVWKLLTGPNNDVPPRLKRLQRFIQSILVALIIIIAFILILRDDLSKRWPFIAASMVIVPLLGTVLRWVFKGPLSHLFLNTAGDAARYFTPMPSNIEERSNIRREGITFLKKLHERKEKPYSKIVIVGHSLGSVVAYDMLRLLWHEMHEQFEPQLTVNHDVFEKEMDIVAMIEKEEDAEKAGMTIEKFQELQNRCWHQYRANGNPWLITDFVTCGAAIAHADFYMLDKTSFGDMTKYKEFPVSPPIMEGTDTSLLFGQKTYIARDRNNKKFPNTVKFLNHASHFAVTRWTNIYFSSDFVGSEAKRCFRWGVKDIKVQRKGLFFIPGGHTNYWDAEAKNKALAHIAEAIGFRQL